MQRRLFLNLATSVLSVFFMVHSAQAETVILTVENAGTGRTVTFTDAQLMELPQEVFKTETIWTEGDVEFSGPTLKAVLEHAEMTLGDVELYAINDYNVVLPVDKIEDAAPIIANRLNGEPFSVREKGPLWVVFPYDDVERYNSEEYFAFSVWQLNKLNVLSE